MTNPGEWLAQRLARGQTVDLRGDGKAGGGLVLAVQAFGSAVASRPDLDVQDWPLFSSARKGANVRAFMRIAHGEVQATCQVRSPQIAVLMNEAAAAEVDFAEATERALYVINTSKTPAEAAAAYGLSGWVATVDGGALGLEFLQRPLGNVAVFAALVRSSELVPADKARAQLSKSLEKRRLPKRLVDANLALFDAALSRLQFGRFEAKGAHAHRDFKGYGETPVGAQSMLRTARKNHTAGYGRPGVAIQFSDASARCNGCTLCVVQCPEGIIEFTADPARGAIVHGARFDDYCKRCRECVTACPLDLFHEVTTVERPEGVIDG